ncbi:CPBP family intramembrane metalloprotease [Macrococcus epidermidis]|uniref:CPBP family intramembrane metalloprotease n=1 Tax=Macrococcus epidermidis TaxID=1902580 RepID=A0A327ZUC6_9STAP|nr:type II CAAX endopeptidase family protein [Macrococcus epidermidis]RAK44608.1 CPBP family intramembrane metalloprotease [Macrococcus epidermidis]
MSLKKFFKVILAVLACFIFSVLIQNITMLWHIKSIWSIEYIFHALTYILLSYILIKWFIEKILKSNLEVYRILPIRLYRLCFISGMVLILTVDLVYIFLIPGKLVMTHYSSPVEYMEMFFSAFLITGVAAPILEEMIFRGILMGYFEKQYGFLASIIVPSILFSLVHLFNGKLHGASLLLLLIGGTLAGIMYAITAWTFNSVWASITLHMFWNINGLFNITNQDDHWGMYQYILDTNNILITGGEYGIDTSLISIIGYLAIIFVMVNKKIKRSIRNHLETF